MMSSNKKKPNGKVIAPSPSTVHAKVRILQNRLPDLSQDVCEDILVHFDWQVEKAAKYLSKNTCVVDNREYSPSPSQNNVFRNENDELTEWPSLNNGDYSSFNWKTGVNRSKSQPLVFPSSRYNFNGHGADNTKNMLTKTVSQKNSDTMLYRQPVPDKWLPIVNKIKTETQSKLFVEDFLKEIKYHEFARIVWKAMPMNETEFPKILVIMRGVPGSGKSTMANLLKLACGRGICLSTDDFFLDKQGHYTFVPEKISMAHDKNQSKCREAMQKGISPIIVDNTNTQIWEMLPYAKMALQSKYDIEILEPNTCWKFDSKELSVRNVHGVSRNQIKKMVDRYEKNITVRQLIEAAGGTYSAFIKQVNCLSNAANIDQLSNDLGDLCSLTSKDNTNGILRSPSSASGSQSLSELKSENSDESESPDLIEFSDGDDFHTNPDVAWVLKNICGDDELNITEHTPKGAFGGLSFEKAIETTPERSFADVSKRVLNANCSVDPITSEASLNLKYKSEHFRNNDNSVNGLPNQSLETSRHRSLSGPSHYNVTKEQVPWQVRNGVGAASTENWISVNSQAPNGKSKARSSSNGVTGNFSSNDLVEDADLFVPVDGEDWFDLKLDPDAVKDLTKAYTGFTLESGDYSEEDLNIRIPPKLAFKLFQYFSLRLMLKTSKKAPDVESVDSTHHTANNDDMNEMERLTSSPSPDLQRIMQVEARLVAREKEDTKILRNSIPNSLAAKLTIDKIKDLFPAFPRERIEVVYAASECSYSTCLKRLYEIASAEGIKANEPSEGGAPGISGAAVRKESNGRESVNNLPQQDNDLSPKETVQWFRQEAVKCHIARLDHQRRAIAAKKEGASYYHWDEYQKLTTRMNKCNELAALVIKSEYCSQNGNSNDIDLHFLYVNEAIEALETHLSKKSEEMRRKRIKKLDIRVITGRGKNSRNGVSKIAPAVVSYLTRNHYSFIDSHGFVIIQLRRPNG